MISIGGVNNFEKKARLLNAYNYKTYNAQILRQIHENFEQSGLKKAPQADNDGECKRSPENYRYRSKMEHPIKEKRENDQRLTHEEGDRTGHTNLVVI